MGASSACCLGERSTLVYAPRITTTFFLGLLLYSLVHADNAMPNVASTLLAFFAIVLLGGVFQALFGLLRLGTLIKFAPHPVMAGFQNMAAVLLFLVQLGNVLGYDGVIGFTHVHEHLSEIKPLSVLVAVLTFVAMWNARRLSDEGPAAAGGPRRRDRGLLRPAVGGLCLRAWSSHRPADRKRGDAERAGGFFAADDGRAAGALDARDRRRRTGACDHRFDRHAAVRQAREPAGRDPQRW